MLHSFLIFIHIISAVQNIFSSAEISNLRKCVDEKCQVKISKGLTTQRYFGASKDTLNFSVDQQVIVYSKEAGTNLNYWGVEIGGRRGYVNKLFIKEEKIFYSNDKLVNIVPTIPISKPQKNVSQGDPKEGTKAEGGVVNSEGKEALPNTQEKIDPSTEVKVDPSPSPPGGSVDPVKEVVPSVEVEVGKVDQGVEVGKIDQGVEIEKVDQGVEVEKADQGVEVGPSSEEVNGSGQILGDSFNGNGLGSESSLPILLSGQDAEFESIKPLVSKEESLPIPGSPRLPATPDAPSSVKPEELEHHPAVPEMKSSQTEQGREGQAMDNEEEGNGNDGEENGSEVVIDTGGEGEPGEKRGETPDYTQDVPAEDPVTQEKDDAAQPASTVAGADLDPTPSEKYEIVDGTAIPLNSDPYPPFENSGSPGSPGLEASQRTNQGHRPTEPTPYPNRHKVPISQPPMLLRNDLQQKVEVKVIDNNLPQGVENDAKSLEQIAKQLNVQPYKDEKVQSEHDASVQTLNEEVGQGDKDPMYGVDPSSEGSSADGGVKREDEFSAPKPETLLNVGSTPDTPVTEPEKESLEMEGKLKLADTDTPIEASSEKSEIESANEEFQAKENIDTETEVPSNASTEDKENSSVPEEQEATGGLFSSFFSSSVVDPVEEKDNIKIDATNEADTPKEVEENFETPSVVEEQFDTPAVVEEKFDTPSVVEEKFDTPTVVEEKFDTPAVVEKFDTPKEVEEDRMTNDSAPTEQVEASAAVEPSLTEEGVTEANEMENPNPNSREVDPSIANLLFVDPDSLLSDEERGQGGFQDASRDVSPQDATHQNDSHSHEGMDESPQEEEGLSLKEQILDASGPLLNEGMSLAIEGELAHPHLSTGTVIFLLVVAGTIVCLYFGHLVVVKVSRESPLLEAMNKMDRSHRIILEENNNLKKRISNSNGQLKSGSYSDPLEVQRIKNQLQTLEENHVSTLSEVQEKNHQLEVDLEASTANEVELHRMLNELLSSQKETSSFEESVNSLQQMLDGQKEIVENLTSDLALKTRLNEELRNELKSKSSKVSKLEYQIEQLSRSMDDVTASKQQYLQKLSEEESSLLSLTEMNASLRREVDEASREAQAKAQDSLALHEQLKKLKKRLGAKEAECQVTKECLKKIQVSSGKGNDVQGKLAEVFKIVEVKTKLATTEKEASSLKAELEVREKSESGLEERVLSLEGELTQLRESAGLLQKEREEAKSKLNVLTQYYEEKEAQLKKELESQEGLLHTVEGSAAVVSNRIQAYELELASCRSQMDSLKTELEEQKQSYKIQLTNEEKKLHDSWLSTRAAERRQEELRQENGQLRQRLTYLQRESQDSHAVIKPSPKRADANGSVSSPISMDNDLEVPMPPHPGMPLDMDGSMPPLPPPPIMPPMFSGRPPLPPHGMPGMPPPPMHPHLYPHLPPHPPMPDRRLPPAGRIASPPGYDRRSYSPGSDYSDHHRYSPGPPRYSPGRHHSPDRKSEHSRRTGNSRRDLRSPSPSHPHQRHSPERWYTQSPQSGGYAKHRRTPPSTDYYEGGSDRRHHQSNPSKGKKTSTPLGPNDR